MSTPTDPSKILLKRVRLSYPNLWTPKSMEEGADPKFAATFLLDKVKHAAVIKQVENIIDRVALEKFTKKVQLKRCCLHDGNEKEDTEGYGDEVMFIVASNDADRPPQVVDLNPNIQLPKGSSKPYAGCYVNALVRFYAWNNTFGKGVSASLLAVQFVENGPSFGAGPVNAADEFENLGGDDTSMFD